jgi:hypothetical protein
MQIVEPLCRDDSGFLRHQCQKLGVGVIWEEIGVSTNLIRTGEKGEPCDRRCVPFALLEFGGRLLWLPSGVEWLRGALSCNG